MRVTRGDSDLCCCVCVNTVMYFEHEEAALASKSECQPKYDYLEQGWKREEGAGVIVCATHFQKERKKYTQLIIGYAVVGGGGGGEGREGKKFIALMIIMDT